MLESLEVVAIAVSLRLAVVAACTSVVTGYVLWRRPRH